MQKGFLNAEETGSVAPCAPRQARFHSTYFFALLSPIPPLKNETTTNPPQIYKPYKSQTRGGKKGVFVCMYTVYTLFFFFLSLFLCLSRAAWLYREGSPLLSYK